MSAPAPVRAMSKNAWKATGILPAVEQVDGKWVVTVADGRVRASAFYTQVRGVWGWDSGTLTVDGVPCETSNGENLREIFTDPDRHLRDCKLVEKPPIDVTVVEAGFVDEPEDDAPAGLRSMYRKVLSQADDAGATVRIGRAAGVWALLLRLGDTRAARVELLDGREVKMHAVSDGDEATLVLGFDQVLSMFLGPAGGLSGPRTMGRPEAAAKVNSVAVRKQSVRRV